MSNATTNYPIPTAGETPAFATRDNLVWDMLDGRLHRVAKIYPDGMIALYQRDDETRKELPDLRHPTNLRDANHPWS